MSKLLDEIAEIAARSDAAAEEVRRAVRNPRAIEGDNSKKAKVGGVAVEQLTSIVERIEKLVEEKKSIGEDIKDVFTEAKGNGYDNATIREMLKLRATDKADREEREALRDTYAHALGVFG